MVRKNKGGIEMKGTFEGKRYDTETAEKIGTFWNGHSTSDFHYEEISMYKTKKGNFFIAGESGALGCFATKTGSGLGWGEGIVPLAKAEALTWAEGHLKPDEYEPFFADIIEDA